MRSPLSWINILLPLIIPRYVSGGKRLAWRGYGWPPQRINAKTYIDINLYCSVLYNIIFYYYIRQPRRFFGTHFNRWVSRLGFSRHAVTKDRGAKSGRANKTAIAINTFGWDARMGALYMAKSIKGLSHVIVSPGGVRPWPPVCNCE
jgi:hypothetical protein